MILWCYRSFIIIVVVIIIIIIIIVIIIIITIKQIKKLGTEINVNKVH